MTRKVIALLAAAAATLLLTAGLGEMALRAGLIDYAKGAYELPQSEPGADGPKILVVGDSFFARPSPIHDRLYEHVRPYGVRLLNSAYPGYGPLQYLAQIARHGPEFEPDIILLGHYVGNDMLERKCSDDAEERIRETLRKAPRPLVEKSLLYNHVNALHRMSNMMTPHVNVEILREVGVPEEDIERASRFELNPYVVRLGAHRPEFYREALLIDTECSRAAARIQTRILEEIVSTADDLQAVLVPIIFPHSFQVSPMHVELYRRWKIEVLPEMLESEVPQNLLKDFYAEHGIPVVDLLPAMRAVDEPLFREEDEHMNVAGQELAATLIARHLRDLGHLGHLGRRGKRVM